MPPAAYLSVRVNAGYNPVNEEWSAEAEPMVVFREHAGEVTGRIESFDLEPMHYIADSFPEINSAIETNIWRMQREVEAVNAEIAAGKEVSFEDVTSRVEPD